MSLDELRAALEALDEPPYCEGTTPILEPLAIVLPDGDLGAVADPGFAEWLVEHGEPAPFGRDRVTLIDEEVRRAIRLHARGDAVITGFSPDAILDDIESALSPREHLTAKLTDVVVYPSGGHFDRHKDTPASTDLVGTLVVGLPVAHTGGGFEIAREREDTMHTVDWSGPVDPTQVRWVAMFSDVDHAVLPVESGFRVTLVYALLRTDRDRRDPSWPKRFGRVHAAVAALQLPPETPTILIACSRHVIGLDDEVVQGVETLRGADRELAQAFVDHGFRVRVRTCLAASDAEDEDNDFEGAPARLKPVGFHEVSFARLAAQLTKDDSSTLEPCITFDAPMGDGGGYEDDEVSDLRPMLAPPLPPEAWIVRRTAAATILGAIEFATDGFVGNGAVESYLYKLAALEVERRVT